MLFLGQPMSIFSTRSVLNPLQDLLNDPTSKSISSYHSQHSIIYTIPPEDLLQVVIEMKGKSLYLHANYRCLSVAAGNFKDKISSKDKRPLSRKFSFIHKFGWKA
jgi:hypothetical protein